jgi:hypothetical protein
MSQKKILPTSSIGASALWKVKFHFEESPALSLERYISLNPNETRLTDDVRDAMGFILFTHYNKRKAVIEEAEYHGTCLY